MMTMERLREIAKDADTQQRVLNYLESTPAERREQGAPMTEEEGRQHWIDTLIHTELRNALNDKLKAACAEYAQEIINRTAV